MQARILIEKIVSLGVFNKLERKSLYIHTKSSFYMENLAGYYTFNSITPNNCYKSSIKKFEIKALGITKTVKSVSREQEPEIHTPFFISQDSNPNSH
jgi:hypothetical protein